MRNTTSRVLMVALCTALLFGAQASFAKWEPTGDPITRELPRRFLGTIAVMSSMGWQTTRVEVVVERSGDDVDVAPDACVVVVDLGSSDYDNRAARRESATESAAATLAIASPSPPDSNRSRITRLRRRPLIRLNMATKRLTSP